MFCNERLSTLSSVSVGDLVVMYSAVNSDYMAASVSALQQYMQDNLTFSEDTGLTTQYAAPSATAFDIQINDASDSVWLVLTPTAGFASGAITLPAIANCTDKQEVLLNCTQTVTSFTVNANGATAVTGEPSTLAADSFFKLRFDGPTKTWYRVG